MQCCGKAHPLPPKDGWYSMDETKTDAHRAAKPWMQNPNFFKRVMIAPAASMKMLMHAYSGCEEGVKSGGKPLEVMGMMLGYPHEEFADTLVVMDVFPLPVTGFETQVVADDENVTNYMIELSDMVEHTRKERLMGWYHSHPFDVDESHNHCFLSSTDMSTQLAWQNSEDCHGNPFLAIVIDPLRSLAKNKCELSAFRAYPPNHSAPANQTPDGELTLDESARVEVWGSCWNRYYELKVEYFMSSQAKSIIDSLNRSHKWTRTLGATPSREPEERASVAERLRGLALKLESADSSATANSGRMGNYLPLETQRSKEQQSVLKKAADAAANLATETTLGQISQVSKTLLLAGTCVECASLAPE